MYIKKILIGRLGLLFGSEISKFLFYLGLRNNFFLLGSQFSIYFFELKILQMAMQDLFLGLLLPRICFWVRFWQIFTFFGIR